MNAFLTGRGASTNRLDSEFDWNAGNVDDGTVILGKGSDPSKHTEN